MKIGQNIILRILLILTYEILNKVILESISFTILNLTSNTNVLFFYGIFTTILCLSVYSTNTCGKADYIVIGGDLNARVVKRPVLDITGTN